MSKLNKIIKKQIDLNISSMDAPRSDYIKSVPQMKKDTNLIEMFNKYHKVPKTNLNKFTERMLRLNQIETALSKHPCSVARVLEKRVNGKKNYLNQIKSLYRENILTNGLSIYNKKETDNYFYDSSNPNLISMKNDRLHEHDLGFSFGERVLDVIDPARRGNNFPLKESWELCRAENKNTPDFFIWLENMSRVECRKPVVFLNEEQIKSKQIFISNGKFIDIDGNPKQTTQENEDIVIDKVL